MTKHNTFTKIESDDFLRYIPHTENMFISIKGEVYKVLNGYKRLYKPRVSNMGYERIRLKVDGIYKEILVHRIVAMNFIDKPKNSQKNLVNHKDGNKLNNNVDNLEWCTQKHNMKHASRMGLMKNGGRKRIEIPKEIIESIILEYTGKYGEKKILMKKYNISYNKITEVLGSYTKIPT